MNKSTQSRWFSKVSIILFKSVLDMHATSLWYVPSQQLLYLLHNARISKQRTKSSFILYKTKAQKLAPFIPTETKESANIYSCSTEEEQ